MAEILQFPLLFAHEQPTQPAPPDQPLPDWRARERALDVRTSCIVEAPAGSGKTGLLIQRYLKLLGDPGVEEPEQVLAITFTVKATAEMHERVMDQIQAAAERKAPASTFERGTRVFADAVLQRDRERGWGLMDRPTRLNIRTIDSLCAEIARSLPVLSGTGGAKSPLSDASPLYQEAARKTLMQLGGPDAELNDAIAVLLLHRDGNLSECERLITRMLGLREQWGRLVPLDRAELTDAFLDGSVLPQLNATLATAICRELTRLQRAFPASLLRELAEAAADFAHLDGYEAMESPIALCQGRNQPPEARAEQLDHWRALEHLLLTQDGKWRTGLAKNHLRFLLTGADKDRLEALLAGLRDNEELREALCRLKKLPPAVYPADQWTVAKALFRVLRRALVELQLVFAERGECDFAELGLAARAALHAESGPDDLAAALGVKTRHILVDEMQDTSTSQYELLEQLTHGWDGQSQTLFLVGDPKQSIYRFRQARVERFVSTMAEGRLGDLTLEPLHLTANFRSQSSLVEQFNANFSQLFPAQVDVMRPEEVPFHAAVPMRGPAQARGAVWHPAVVQADTDRDETTRRRRKQSAADAREVREVAMHWLDRELPPGRATPWRVAVLVRSRAHLARIVAEFQRDDGEGAVPFCATEIDALGERQEVLDLLGLTRALLHPADSVAWFAVLHAPWCGLGLADLHVLAGADDPDLRENCVLDRIAERGHMLSADGEARLTRVWPVLVAGADAIGRTTVAEAVERTWRSLGGDAPLDRALLSNAIRFFQLLDELEAEDGRIDPSRLAERTKSLYAEAAVDENAVELITIHKAKGLEWDVVIVPALEKQAQSERGKLLDWVEIEAEDGESQFVFAPIRGAGEDSTELHTWIRSVDAEREQAERKRLLYVACTRAREELHLFAAPERSTQGVISPKANSLLRTAWPLVEDLFATVEPIVLPWPTEDDVEEGELPALAAEAQVNRHAAPRLQRLPSGYDPMARFAAARPLFRAEVGPEPNAGPFQRPEGSLAARSFGNAVHALLEVLAQRMEQGENVAALAVEVAQWTGRIGALLRGDGLAPATVERETGRVVEALRKTLHDPHGKWILAPHPGAANEVAMTGWATDEGAARTSIRLDRMFRAGAAPGEEGTDYLWIVDYKTASHGAEGLDDFIQLERVKYQPQLEVYSRNIIRMLAPADFPRGIRLALYYPVLARLEWWDPAASNPEVA